ncbi:MAG TPA: hypothetical protein VHG89_12195 [Verrucomicrobiae bacterium]|nr:hypothetical protein [Verrucomicrobiae bacterium]
MASAYYFTRIWQLPQSARLETQTLNKLAVAPWLSLSNDIIATNALRLRPLLNDIVQEESYFEIRQLTNQSKQMIFAIRLGEEQARYWQTNFPAVLHALPGIHIVENADDAWTVQNHGETNKIKLARINNWTVIGWSDGKSDLLNEAGACIRQFQVPFSGQKTTNANWLEADIDLQRAAKAFSIDWGLPENSPRISFTMNGDGGSVFTRGKAVFPKPLEVEMEPWNIPVHLMHEPLIGFTAIRGIKSWLVSMRCWNELQINPPNQIYLWSLQGSPYQTYLAAPMANAENQMQSLTSVLLQKSNPWLAAHGYVGFEKLPDANGVKWGSDPSILPFIKTDNTGWFFAGLLPDTVANAAPPSQGMIHDVTSRTNLLYYDWEVSAPRVQSTLYLGQFIRQISRQPQLPLNSVGAVWLNTIMPRLDASTTVATLTNTNELSLLRRSTLGFTALELQILIDWLESPQFPSGL